MLPVPLSPLQKFFQSGVEESAASYLTIEWTNQHACGGNEDNDPHKPNCNLVIQYMVQDYDGDQAGKSGGSVSYIVSYVLVYMHELAIFRFLIR